MKNVLMQLIKARTHEEAEDMLPGHSSIPGHIASFIVKEPNGNSTIYSLFDTDLSRGVQTGQRIVTIMPEQFVAFNK